MSVRYVHRHLEDSPRLGPFTPLEWAFAIAATVLAVLVLRYTGLPLNIKLCVAASLAFAVHGYKLLRESGEDRLLGRASAWARFMRRPRRWRPAPPRRVAGYLLSADPVDPDFGSRERSLPPAPQELWQ